VYMPRLRFYQMGAACLTRCQVSVCTWKLEEHDNMFIILLRLGEMVHLSWFRKWKNRIVGEYDQYREF
jgi:hypothetical protein